MSTVQEIESAITRLSLPQQQELRAWLENFVEDQLELTPEFREKIERAQKELAAGNHSRIRTIE